jgi:hypothetical protein
MSLSVPSIQNALVSMNVNPAVVNPLLENLPISLPIYFNNVANMQVLSGSFTPANNTMSLASAIPSLNAPNFVMLVTDGQVNLTVKSGVTILANSSPVMKCYINSMAQNSTYNITDILLDGTTTASTPMPQGVLVNWTLIYCQSMIS